MQERVQLLGVSVDVASTKMASDATIEYIKEESSKVIYFFNSETLFLLQENHEWRNIVEDSELILPGTVNVNGSIDDVLGHKRDPFFFESYLDALLDYTVETGCEVLLVTENENQFVSVQEHIHEKRPFLTLSGISMEESDESLDYIVNEINSVAPDILLMAIEEKKQLQLLEQYRAQMNAGLMLFIGNVLYNRAVAESEVPEKIQKLKIANLYKLFHKVGIIKTFFNNIWMKIRIRQNKREKDS